MTNIATVTIAILLFLLNEFIVVNISGVARVGYWEGTGPNNSFHCKPTVYVNVP